LCFLVKKHAAFKWKDAISGFPVSPGSAEALVRWGWKIKYVLILYFLHNIFAKKFCNRAVHVKITASQMWDVFLRHIVVSGCMIQRKKVTVKMPYPTEECRQGAALLCLVCWALRWIYDTFCWHVATAVHWYSGAVKIQEWTVKQLSVGWKCTRASDEVSTAKLSLSVLINVRCSYVESHPICILFDSTC